MRERVGAAVVATVKKNFGHLERQMQITMKNALENHLTRALLMAETTADKCAQRRTNSTDMKVRQLEDRASSMLIPAPGATPSADVKMASVASDAMLIDGVSTAVVQAPSAADDLDPAVILTSPSLADGVHETKQNEGKPLSTQMLSEKVADSDTLQSEPSERQQLLSHFAKVFSKPPNKSDPSKPPSCANISLEAALEQTLGMIARFVTEKREEGGASQKIAAELKRMHTRQRQEDVQALRAAADKLSADLQRIQEEIQRQMEEE